MAIPPFLKPQRRDAGVIMTVRQPDGSKPQVEDSEDQGLTACSDDLIRAIHAKDAAGVTSALKSAFEILDSEPQDQDAGDDVTEENDNRGNE